MAGATGVAAPKKETPRKRVDPKRRPVTGDFHWEVKNKRKGYHYVGAYKGYEGQNHEYFAALGYEVVTWQGVDENDVPKAEYFAGYLNHNRRIGEPMERMGHLLMRIKDEDLQAIRFYGPDGNSGQNMANERERLIKGGKGVDRDPFKGLSLMGSDGPLVELTDKNWAEEQREEDDG